MKMENNQYILKKVWLGFCLVLIVFFTCCLIFEYKPFTSEQQNSQYQQLLYSPNVKVETYQNFQDTINSKQTALYFLGYENCPWCEDALPILIDEAQKSDIVVHYINTKGLKNDKENYQMMQTLLKPILNSDNKIYFPNVIAIKNGQIQGNHVGTVESYDPQEREMNNEEEQQLRVIYKGILEELQ